MTKEVPFKLKMVTIITDCISKLLSEYVADLVRHADDEPAPQEEVVDRVVEPVNLEQTQVVPAAEL